MIALLSLSGAGALMYGVALAVMAYKTYSFQRELRQGTNADIALSIGLHQGIMANVLMETLSLAFPGIVVSRWAYFLLSTTMFLLPVLSSFPNGGYAKIKKSWQSSDSMRACTDYVDRMVQKVPEPMLRICKRMSVAIQDYYDSFLYLAQIVSFGAVAVLANPIAGIVGLGYMAVSEARARGFLATKISTVLERFDYWVGMCSGIFTKSLVLKISSIFSLASTVAINILLPKVMQYVLGKDSEFLQVMDVNKPQPAPILVPTNISVPQFNKLLEAIPDLNIAGMVSEESRIAGIGSELEALFDRMLPNLRTQIAKAIEPLEQALARLQSDYYADMSALRQNASFLNRMKGHLTDIKFSLQQFYLQTKIKLYTSYSFYSGAITFFDHDEKNSQSGLAVTVNHMAQVPSKIPDIEPIDLDEFRALVDTSNLQNSINALKAKCFKEPKFQIIDTALQEELFALQDAGADNAKVAAVHHKMLQAWRVKLALDATLSDDEIVIAYTKHRLEAVYYKISTGRDMQFDKSAVSIVDFQKMGQHVLRHYAKMLRDLAKNPNKQQEAEVHDLLIRMGNEAADHCANGIIDVILDTYYYRVLNNDNAHEGVISQYTPQEQLALSLQNQRAELFEIGYNMAKDSTQVKTMLPHVAWEDKHTRSFIENLGSVLHLPKQRNATTDLSNINSAGFVLRLEYGFIFYLGMRAMMLVPQGYSPEAIVENMMIAAKAPQTAGVFNPINCCLAWAKCFGSDLDVMTDKETARGTVNELLQNWYADRDEDALRKLFTLMLIDLGVFKITNTQLQTAVNDILAEGCVVASKVADVTNGAVSAPAVAADRDRTVIFSKQSSSRPAATGAAPGAGNTGRNVSSRCYVM